jgi:hypothetical protein
MPRIFVPLQELENLAPGMVKADWINHGRNWILLIKGL